jgi:hypothetical protein
MIRADLGGNLQIRAEERRTELGNQLLPGIAFIAPFHPAHIAIEAGRMFCPVGELMRQRGGMTFGIDERLEGWHLHVIRTLGIEGAISAMPDFSTGRGKELLGAFDARKWGQGRGLGRGAILRG